jgi:hypothetical protein
VDELVVRLEDRLSDHVGDRVDELQAGVVVRRLEAEPVLEDAVQAEHCQWLRLLGSINAPSL